MQNIQKCCLLFDKVSNAAEFKYNRKFWKWYFSRYLIVLQHEKLQIQVLPIVVVNDFKKIEVLHIQSMYDKDFNIIIP